MADIHFRDHLCRLGVRAGRLEQAEQQRADRLVGTLAAAAGFADGGVAKVGI